jgi:hypothetical protein
MRIAWVAAAGLLAFLACGCQMTVPLRVGNLPTSATPVNKSLILLSQASDARKNPSDQIGRHTISVFMIPGFGVFARGGHIEDAVSIHCKTGLEKAGYTVTTVDRVSEASGPVLVPQLNYVRNYCFTWLYPLALTFGRMRLSLVLFSPRQEVLWKADLKAQGGFGASLLYVAGFGTATKFEMTGSIKEVMRVCSTPEFIAALEKAQAVAP